MQKANPLPELCAVPILVLVIYDDDGHHDHPDVNDDENVVHMSCNEDPNKEGQSITCALCSSHPGLGDHDDGDDHHDHPDVNDDERSAHVMSRRSKY